MNAFLSLKIPAAHAFLRAVCGWLDGLCLGVGSIADKWHACVWAGNDQVQVADRSEAVQRFDPC